MDSKTKTSHFDHLEIVGGGVLQPLDVARREAEFDTRRQPHNDAAAGIVMCTLGTRPTQSRLFAGLGGFKLLLGQFNHGYAFIRPSTRPDGPLLPISRPKSPYPPLTPSHQSYNCDA